MIGHGFVNGMIGGRLPFSKPLSQLQTCLRSFLSLIMHKQDNHVHGGEKMLAIFTIMAKMARKSMAKMANINGENGEFFSPFSPFGHGENREKNKCQRAMSPLPKFSSIIVKNH